MKHWKIVLICLIVGIMLYGCKVGEIEEHQFEFHKVFFNSTKTYTFEIGRKITLMKRYHFNCATPMIFYDADNYNYCKYKGQDHWSWGYRYLHVEIHLKSKDYFRPGTEDRGKFGLHPWSELK